ncbi:hypothetical protein TYRP_003135 [Tyrophagus putrescentiae]|nr:hypothetical protein TYRP_003135 [Tyrophagus putrescentiae]
MWTPQGDLEASSLHPLPFFITLATNWPSSSKRQSQALTCRAPSTIWSNASSSWRIIVCWTSPTISTTNWIHCWKSAQDSSWCNPAAKNEARNLRKRSAVADEAAGALLGHRLLHRLKELLAGEAGGALAAHPVLGAVEEVVQLAAGLLVVGAHLEGVKGGALRLGAPLRRRRQAAAAGVQPVKVEGTLEAVQQVALGHCGSGDEDRTDQQQQHIK